MSWNGMTLTEFAPMPHISGVSLTNRYIESLRYAADGTTYGAGDEVLTTRELLRAAADRLESLHDDNHELQKELDDAREAIGRESV